MFSSELVSVAVPKELLPLVYGVIAQHTGGAEGTPPPVQPPTAPASGPASTDLPNPEWTASRIRKAVEETSPGMRDILRTLATNADQWLDTDKLAKGIRNNPKASAITIAGTTGAFRKLLKGKRFGLDTLPYDRRYQRGTGMVLRMHRDIARGVLDAIKNVHDNGK